LDLEQLKTWAKEQTEHEPTFCILCSPQQNIETESHLTKLDRDILDFVLESATIHMEVDERPYLLNVGMVARCLDKTVGQLTAAFNRLVDDGLLALVEKVKLGEAPSPRCGIMPTAKALRTLPYFSALDDSQIDDELSKLRHGN
jgi:hypothetical protein